MTTLGLKGAELDTVMQGHTWDEPQFLPLFKAAEALGAVLFGISFIYQRDWLKLSPRSSEKSPETSA